MTVLFATLAGGVVLLHLAFVLFAAGGALLALRWRWVPWVHLPAAGWAAFIEFTGRVCPLTPLENLLRRNAGLPDYGGDFVARYLFPVLYPAGLTSDAQIVIGMLVVIVNLVLYVAVYRRQRAERRGDLKHRPGV